MTPQRVKELLPVLQAYAEGKTIQWLDDEQKPALWRDCINIISLDAHVDFRIKPEPKDFYTVFCGFGTIFTHHFHRTKEDVSNCPSCSTLLDKGRYLMHVTEIVDDSQP